MASSIRVSASGSADQRRVRRSTVVSSIAPVTGAIIALIVTLLSVLAPLLVLADPTEIDLAAALLPPQAAHPLGTDMLGRDMLSRVLWAGRTSLAAAALVLGVSLVLGVLVGAVAGYVGGIVDQICVPVIDAFLALPTWLVALALIGTVGASTPALVFALAVAWWAPYARLARSQVLVLRASPYVEAAEAIGGTRAHILRQHILPGVLGALAIQASLDVGMVLLAIGGLSFLGMGVQPPDPEWGTMLVEARPVLDYAPHVMIAPGLALFLTVFGFNALGELLAARLRPHQ
jgi:ABC-type dipeptide/oligopeptide/nickel transport system permease subunit